MRRLFQLLLIAAVVPAAACSGSNPVAPSSFPASGLDARSEPPANVNGVIDEFAGTRDDFQFVVGDVSVHGDTDTDFFGESIFENLADGVRVEVKGVARQGFVYAKRIHVDSRTVNDDDDASEPPPPPCSWPVSDDPVGPFPTAPRFGEIFLSALSGTEPDLVLSGAGRPVYTSSATIVRRNDDLLPMWILRPGMIVEIFGSWSSVQIDAAEINLSRDTLDATAEGEASLVTGDYPEVRFVVGSTAFLANEWTRFSGSPCDALVDGAMLRVRGVRMADGVTVLATFVEQVTP